MKGAHQRIVLDLQNHGMSRGNVMRLSLTRANCASAMALLAAALVAAAATAADGGARITAGNLELAFTATGELTALTTTQPGGGSSWSRSLAASSGRAAVDNATTVSSTVVQNATSLCVRRVAKVGGRPLSIEDCFQPSPKAADAVQWTTTVSSSAPSQWSAAIRRGLDFRDTPPSEELWIPADTTANGSSSFLLATYPVSAVGTQTFWLGGKLTTAADGCKKAGKGCSGAYAFKGPTLSVPVVATLAKAHDSALVMALDLDDFLSTQLSLQTTQNSSQSGWMFGYEQYRLGGGSAPLVLRADIAAIPADARAAAGFVASRHPTFFKPPVAAATTLASGTSWYSKCGPGVGGCDLIDSNKTFSNETFAAELAEIAFKWVWNNNFAEYFMGNCEW